MSELLDIFASLIVLVRLIDDDEYCAEANRATLFRIISASVGMFQKLMRRPAIEYAQHLYTRTLVVSNPETFLHSRAAAMQELLDGPRTALETLRRDYYDCEEYVQGIRTLMPLEDAMSIVDDLVAQYDSGGRLLLRREHEAGGLLFQRLHGETAHIWICTA